MAQIRIDKYLADMGIGTRSEVKKTLKVRSGNFKWRKNSKNQNKKLTVKQTKF